MKTILAGFALTMMILVACDKSETSAESYDLQGSYLGSFHRTGMDTSVIRLYFERNHFNGSSSIPEYPAICGGSFNVEGSTINFTDSCTWQADFDWSLILSGRFNFSVTGDKIRIWKTNGTVTDEYQLRKEVR